MNSRWRASVSTLFSAPEGVQTAKGDRLSAPALLANSWKEGTLSLSKGAVAM